MRKISLAFLLLSTSTLALTPEETSALSYAARYYRNGLEYEQMTNFDSAISSYKDCAQSFTTMLNKNAALATENIDANSPAITVKDALAFCLQRPNALATLGSDEVYQLRRDMASVNRQVQPSSMTGTDSIRVDDLNRCLTLVNTALKKYPALTDMPIDSNAETPVTTKQLGAYCQAQLSGKQKEAAQNTAGAVATIQKVTKNYDSAVKSLQAGLAAPATTDPQVLLKLMNLENARSMFSSMATGINGSIEPGVKLDGGMKIGSRTLKQLLDGIDANFKKADAAIQQLKPRSDKAFANQDAQVRVNMPKVAGGDKLNIFRRQGIPDDWAGGPVYSKNGIYSGNGAAVAKDIASSTMWFYADNGRGCTYRYYFNKNTVTKVEKPLGC